MHPKTNLMSIVLVLCILAFVSAPVSADSTQVLGKVTIAAGVILSGMIFTSNSPLSIRLNSFEEQTLYITKEFMAEPGQHDGGFIADGSGFAHLCPQHGREPMPNGTLILVPKAIVDGVKVIIKLF